MIDEIKLEAKMVLRIQYFKCRDGWSASIVEFPNKTVLNTFKSFAARQIKVLALKQIAEEIEHGNTAVVPDSVTFI